MAQADRPAIVEEKDYIPELEEEVAFHVTTSIDLPKNEHLHKPIKIPEFKNPIDQETWEVQQIERCRKGYKNMPGKQ